MDGPLGSRISARTWGALLLPPVVLVLLAWILSPFLRGHPAGWLCAAGLAAVACALPVLLLRRAAVVSDEPLIRAASRWGRGELEYRIDGPRLARLGPLAAALNRMASSLQVRDETARLRAAERLQQSEKLATVGQLAAGVAHEINNPIGGILLYGNLLVESTQPDDPRYENMKKIVGQASRAKEIVRGLLDFARQNPPRIERVDLNQVLVESLALVERHPGWRNVQLRKELSPVPLWVRIDVQKIQQVFLNVLMNALDAMRAHGGTLTIRSGFSERDGFCRVAFTDTGVGIPEEHLPRVFEPFFTTKEVGEGVGLGLSISYGIVRQHGGEIEAQSTAGSGTTFRVLLPVEPDVAPV